MAGSERTTRRAAPIALPVAALVVALDQLTKHWALNALTDGPTHVVWTLRFKLAFNSGMAFSRGEGAGPIIGVVALVVVVAFVVGLARSRGARPSWSVAIGMIVGGAAGNLADRVFRGEGRLHGSVVDFIDLQWWPIFNVADMGITIGGVWLLVASALAGRADRGGTSPAGGTAGDAGGTVAGGAGLAVAGGAGSDVVIGEPTTAEPATGGVVAGGVDEDATHHADRA